MNDNYNKKKVANGCSEFAKNWNSRIVESLSIKSIIQQLFYPKVVCLLLQLVDFAVLFASCHQIGHEIEDFFFIKTIEQARGHGG